jgi:hypothetical protein
MAAPPSLATVGLSGPFYLRKLPRRNSLGNPDRPLDERVPEVVEVVFLRDSSPYSLFLVQSDEDLRRVTMGINGGRSSLREDVNFLPQSRNRHNAE